MALGAMLAASGRLDSALEHYRKAATLGAEPAVYLHLADLHARAGHVDDAARARAMYQDALQRARAGQGVR
jgi:tetratricopeptide (TPR) repeat protein